MKYVMVNEDKINRAKKVAGEDAIALLKEYNKIGGRIVNELNEKIEEIDIESVKATEVFQHEAIVEKKKDKVEVKATAKVKVAPVQKKEVKEDK